MTPSELNEFATTALHDLYPNKRWGKVIVATPTEVRGSPRWCFNLARRGGRTVCDDHSIITFVKLDRVGNRPRSLPILRVYRVPAADIQRYRPKAKTIIVADSVPGRRRKRHFLDPYVVPLPN